MANGNSLLKEIQTEQNLGLMLAEMIMKSERATVTVGTLLAFAK